MSNIQLQAIQLEDALGEKNAAQIALAARTLAAIAASPDVDSTPYWGLIDLAERAETIASA